MYNSLLGNEKNENNQNNVNKFFNGIYIIYWINLEKSVNRRINMENMLCNFTIHNERIFAIDGTIDNNIKSKYFILNNNENYPNYSNTEYAILASHLYTINKFIETYSCNDKYDVCLIFEDDLSLDFKKYWNKSINDIIINAPSDWEIIMLGYFSLKLDYEEYTKWDNEWSALAYLVNRRNINSNCKLDELKIYYNENGNFKWKCNKNDLMVSDNYIFSKFNTYVYKYPYFTFPNNNDSTLHEDHLNYHKIYKNCNYLVWNDIIDKLF
jgi:GR25 family glycosyltransferase involved in LPS biosynthesis